jgi:hypothetical protein
VGHGLYQSDVAADVRTVYRDCKKLGFAGSDLAAIVLETVGAGSADSEDGQLAHLALADLLCKDRMLPKALQQTALRIIKSPELPARFEDQTSRLKHRKMLDALGAKLAAARIQPKRKLPSSSSAISRSARCCPPLPKGRWAPARHRLLHAVPRQEPDLRDAGMNIAVEVPPAARSRQLRFMRRREFRSWASSRRRKC